VLAEAAVVENELDSILRNIRCVVIVVIITRGV
jgi:hypothetical protein